MTTTRIFINAASCRGQARNLYAAGQLLTNLMETHEHLVDICAGLDKTYRDEPLEEQRITDGHTFRDVIGYCRKQIEAEQQQQADQQHDVLPLRDRFRQFTTKLARFPLAGQEFATEAFECVLGDTNVQYSAIGYAAHFTQPFFEGTAGEAVVLSLDGCEAYNSTHIDVLYTAPKVDIEPRIVWNVTKPEHISTVRRHFRHNEKHDKAMVFENMTIAEMDLRGEAAQRLLHQAVALEGETRLFARHKGRIYIFPCHRPEIREYHGFPVKPTELKQRMPDICNRLHRDYGWEELRP